MMLGESFTRLGESFTWQGAIEVGFFCLLYYGVEEMRHSFFYCDQVLRKMTNALTSKRLLVIDYIMSRC